MWAQVSKRIFIIFSLYVWQSEEKKKKFPANNKQQRPKLQQAPPINE